VLVAIGATLAAAAPGAGEPPAIRAKQAEARRVLAQVDALDVQLGRLDEQLNGARYDLSQVQGRERRTAATLRTAKTQYARAQRRVARRIVTIYESTPPTTADAIFGATSLSDILDRLQLVDAASALDHRIVQNAQTWRNELLARESALESERRQKAAAVAAISAHEHTISAELAQRRVLLAAVQGEVRRLQAAEAARQARLAAEAKARLEAQARARAEAAAAARAAALARAERAAHAAAAAHASRPAPATSTPTTATTTAADPAPDPTTTASTPPPAPTTTAAPTTTEQTPTPPPPTAPGHPQAATIALRYLGVPYVFGGATPAGFDCSGLVMYVYAQLGISLPHYAAAQYQYGVAVPRNDLQPGDLVFFDGLNHVGIYIGGNQFVHAPETGDVVKISTLTGWFAANYVGARRI
jgi:cell wall-associated NlpC family hydrolase